MNLHDCETIDHRSISRVHGGWIYHNQDKSVPGVFVPYHEEEIKTPDVNLKATCEKEMVLYTNGYNSFDPLSVNLTGPCGTVIRECGLPDRLTNRIPKSILNSGPILCPKCRMKKDAYLHAVE